MFARSLVRAAARAACRERRPIAVAVFGSAGKSTAASGVLAALSLSHHTRAQDSEAPWSEGFYALALGEARVPETPLGWVLAAARGYLRALNLSGYPAALVFEVPPSAAAVSAVLDTCEIRCLVVTALGAAPEPLSPESSDPFAELQRLSEHLPEHGVLIANGEATVPGEQSKDRRIATYGTGKKDSVRGAASGSDLTVTGENLTMTLPLRSPAPSFTRAVLAGAAAAEALQLSPDLTEKGLRQLRALPGRQSTLPGIKRSLIIDDTANTNPESFRESLELLTRGGAGYRIAVVGDTGDPGAAGRLLAGASVDRLLAVGSRGRDAADAAVAAGLKPERVVTFERADEAGRVLQNMLPPGAGVLMAGRPGDELEIAVREIMAEPMRAAELLCRRGGPKP